ncbi:MAG TPA: hypothetical protein VIU41_08140 [Geobacteraceae bacterium]
MSTERCDTKIWSGTCEHSSYKTLGEKYLCDVCGTLSSHDHEVSHEGFIHISGDEHSLS